MIIMELSITELANCMEMPPSTIERWIRQGRIPVKRRGDTCIFNSQILKKWAADHNMTFALPGSAGRKMVTEEPENLLAVIQRGGVHYDVAGNTVESVLRSAVDRMNAIGEQYKDPLYETLIAREQMMSTGIGNGVAVPHPRTPMSDSDIPAQIAVCFLNETIDYHAIDKKPVSVLFVLVAPTAKRHLYLLSRIAFCLRDSGFIRLLARVPDPETLLATISEFEMRLDSAR